MNNFFDIIKENEIEFIDFRFTDLNGLSHNILFAKDKIDQNILNSGIIYNHNILLIPDLSTGFIDPFSAQNTYILYCSVKSANDPRSLTIRAFKYLEENNLTDSKFSSNIEFHIFDDVRFDNKPNNSFYKIDSQEGIYNTGKKYHSGNLGYRNIDSSCVSPIDSSLDIRSEIMMMLKNSNISSICHMHNKNNSQSSIKIDYYNLIDAADNIIKAKYIIRNVVYSYGKSASFMASPVRGCNSSLSISQKFRDSSNIIHYIAGIIKHLSAISAFTSPTTNSYRRLYNNKFDKSFQIDKLNISYSDNEVKINFSDSSANPYLAISAIIMAGIDGIINNIILDDNEIDNIDKFPKSLSESIYNLSLNREFLLTDNIFTNQMIDQYIEMKNREINEVESSISPVEFALYYNN